MTRKLSPSRSMRYVARLYGAGPGVYVDRATFSAHDPIQASGTWAPAREAVSSTRARHMIRGRIGLPSPATIARLPPPFPHDPADLAAHRHRVARPGAGTADCRARDPSERRVALRRHEQLPADRGPHRRRR